MQKRSNSPCVRNCCLDDKDVCLGCFRTLDEIVAWTSFSDAQQQQVLHLCEQRKHARKQHNLSWK